MRAKSRVFVLIVMLGIILFVYYSNGYAKDTRGVTDDTIKIGSISDLTGPISNLGLGVVEAQRNYIHYINDQRGGIHGRKIKLIVEDDRYSIPLGMAAYKKLVYKDQVFALLGPVSTGFAKTLFRHVQKDKLPNISIGLDKEMMEPYKRYVFPTTGNYESEMGVIFDYILNELKPRDPKIALVYPDVESGKVARDAAEYWAKFFGVELYKEVVPIATIDLTSTVLSLKRAKVTHVIFHHATSGAVLFLKTVEKFGVNLPYFGTTGCTLEDTVKGAGKASKNFLGFCSFSSWYEDTPGTKKMTEISNKYNPNTLNLHGNKFYSIGWLGAMMLYEGLKRTGKELNGEAFVDALETIKDFDTEGLCGSVTYTPTIHYMLRHVKAFKSDPQNGRFIPIKGWRLPPSKK